MNIRNYINKIKFNIKLNYNENEVKAPILLFINKIIF